MNKEDLQEVREWADLQIASAELPSTWYQLMKLREALDPGHRSGDSSRRLIAGDPRFGRSPPSGRHR